MKVAVVGAGTMGAGIAQAAAAAHQVSLYDSEPAALEQARQTIHQSLTRLVDKGQLPADEAEAHMGRIHTTSTLGALAQSGIVIEAVYEDLTIKREVWRTVAPVVPEQALLASNTSSLSITELAAFSGRPEYFCGLHFFNPVALLPLVEVVRGVRTSEATLTSARRFVDGIGKTAIVCDDRPGFIVNRLLIPYLNDAAFALSEGVASAEDIDRAMTLGANMPMGPLALCDLVGLDVVVAATESLHREFGDPKFRVAPLLRRMVRAGRLGRKSGEGFYRYRD